MNQKIQFLIHNKDIQAPNDYYNMANDTYFPIGQRIITPDALGFIENICIFAATTLKGQCLCNKKNIKDISHKIKTR